MSEAEPQSGMTCPFCRETDDWDLIGLKMHLQHHCKVYRATERVHNPFFDGVIEP